MIVLAAGARASERVSALDAWAALPDEFAGGVLRITADNGDPNPETWYFTAQAGGASSPMHTIVVERGQVISNRPTLGLREIFSAPAQMRGSEIRIDSTDAFAICQQYAMANNQRIASVSYALRQQGSQAVPIWSVWCYDARGSYLGRLDLLASDGSVIANDAFPIAP